jgi:hypothetical protein
VLLSSIRPAAACSSTRQREKQLFLLCLSKQPINMENERQRAARGMSPRRLAAEEMLAGCVLVL